MPEITIATCPKPLTKLSFRSFEQGVRCDGRSRDIGESSYAPLVTMSTPSLISST
jgi:hypothetical protein